MSSILDGLAPMFVAVFGDSEAARYSRADGSWSGDVTPIFRDPAMVVETGDGPGTVVRQTTFDFAVADLAGGYGQNDTIAFRGWSWIVRAALPDGHGMVTLQVEAG